MKILVVEDQPSLAMLLVRYLEPIATEISVAYTMSEAKAKLASANDFAIVTLDLNLPDSQTDRTLAELKSLRFNNSEVLVIVITGMLTLQEAERAFDAGADGFMSKQSVSIHSKDFLTALREIVYSVLRNPRRFQKNIALLEAVVGKISQYITSSPQ